MELWSCKVAADCKTIYYQSTGDPADGLEIPIPVKDHKHFLEMLPANSMLEFLSYTNGEWTADLDKLKALGRGRYDALDWMKGLRSLRALPDGYTLKFSILP